MLKRFHIFDAGILSQSCHSVVAKPAVAGILKTKESYKIRACETNGASRICVSNNVFENCTSNILTSLHNYTSSSIRTEVNNIYLN